MAVNDGTLNGWPFINHAMDLRNTNTPNGPQRQTIVYPRQKYTYFVDFRINDYVWQNEAHTNLKQFIDNGKLNTTLKNISHPKMNYKVETLRSYNKYVKLVTQLEFGEASMIFHDDNASLAMALWKEYISFYTYGGNIGSEITNIENSKFRSGNSLVGEDMRSQQNIRPSVGMRLRNNNGIQPVRHFFDNIVLYDLGSDPDSVNIYYFVHPVITSFSQSDLDTYDREGLSDVTMNFEFENYYFAVGVNNNAIGDMMEAILGVRNAEGRGNTRRINGHILQNSNQTNTPSSGNSQSQNPNQGNLPGNTQNTTNNPPLNAGNPNTGIVPPDRITQTPLPPPNLPEPGVPVLRSNNSTRVNDELQRVRRITSLPIAQQQTERPPAGNSWNEYQRLLEERLRTIDTVTYYNNQTRINEPSTQSSASNTLRVFNSQ